MESTAKRRVSLQMKMLIGFLLGLGAGLVVYATQADAPWVANAVPGITPLPLGLGSCPRTS